MSSLPLESYQSNNQCVHMPTAFTAHMATNTPRPSFVQFARSINEPQVNEDVSIHYGVGPRPFEGNCYPQFTADTPLWLRGLLEGLSLFPRLAGGWFWEVPHGGGRGPRSLPMGLNAQDHA